MKNAAKIQLLLLVLTTFVKAQFTHPTTGVNGEFVGACETATCGGTYFDNGGAGGNYSNSINNIYRVFCPNTAGNCVRLTFTAFSVEQFAASCLGGPPFNFGDWLTIGNGPTQNSPLFTTAPANAAGRICGTPAVPFSYTSTHASGCLTLRFRSDGSVNQAGWSANISCVPCAGGPSGLDNSDCQGATAVCSAASFTDNSSGPGIRAEGCAPGSCPAGGENFSNWYQVLISTSGTLNFTISPFNAAQDYDFAVYGPSTSCSALGTPVKCNDSGTTGNTGCGATGTNNTEIVSGIPFCSPMNVLAGQSYYIVIDSWSPPAAPIGYNVTWGGTSTFNCAILPVEMVRFTANYNMAYKTTELVWETKLESNIDYFSVEKSLDAKDFKQINKVYPYSENSVTPRVYVSKDDVPVSNEINYYRIVAYDKNGRKTISNMQAVAFQDDDANLNLIPNPSKNMVNLSFKSVDQKNWAILVFDQKGNRVETLEYRTTVNGINSLELDLTSYKAGMYFVNITDGIDFFKRKLIKE